MIAARKLYFVGLNAVRALSIISLILVFSSTILVMVKNIQAVNAFEAAKIEANGTDIQELLDCEYIEGSTVPNQPAGIFWAIVASLLIIFQTIILFLSEISWPMAFFNRFFPVLGSEFGLGALGIFQGLISTQILSHHVDDFTLVSAFFLFAIACINMLLGLIFRAGAKEKRSIRGWRADAKNVLPTNEKDLGPPTYSNGMGWGRQAEQSAGLRGYILSQPTASLPRHVSFPTPKRASTHSDESKTLGRSESSVSSASSFAATHRENRQDQLKQAIYAQDRHEREPESRPETPVFKSSKTAL